MPLIAIGVGLIGSGIASGIIGAKASTKAANAQQQAAMQAAGLQHADAVAALNYQKQTDAYNRSTMAPFIASGTAANKSLAFGLGIKPDYSTQSVAPVAPQASPSQAVKDAVAGLNDPRAAVAAATAADSNVSPDQATTNAWAAQGIPFENIPIAGGYSVARRTDNDPIEASTRQATASVPATPADQAGATDASGQPLEFGSLLKGFDEKFAAPSAGDLENDPEYQARLKIGNDLLAKRQAASGTVFSGGALKDASQFNADLASEAYGATYNRRMSEYLTRYNVFNNNQTNSYNRLAGVSGAGQQATTNLGGMLESGSNNASTILLNSGQQIGNDITAAGNARASGYVGRANAVTGAIQNTGGSLLDLYLLSQLGKH